MENKVSYKAIKKNQTLSGFISESEKEAENESD